MVVIFHRLAIREYQKGREWYRASSPFTAERFKLAVDAAVNRIKHDPDGNQPIDRLYRYVRVRRFPYILIYRRQADGSVMITAAAHTSRRAGYWRRRR